MRASAGLPMRRSEISQSREDMIPMGAVKTQTRSALAAKKRRALTREIAGQAVVAMQRAPKAIVSLTQPNDV